MGLDDALGAWWNAMGGASALLCLSLEERKLYEPYAALLVWCPAVHGRVSDEGSVHGVETVHAVDVPSTALPVAPSEHGVVQGNVGEGSEG